MPRLTRRATLLAPLAIPLLPRFAIAQADQRPVVTVAVQRIANSNTLCILNEASNVGTRHYTSYKEPLIDTDWTGELSTRPGLAESWRMVDERSRFGQAAAFAVVLMLLSVIATAVQLTIRAAILRGQRWRGR